MGPSALKLLSASFMAAVLVFAAVPFCEASSVKARARASVETGERKPVTVVSDSMEALSGDRVVVFRGNVMAEEDFTICSDELHVRYGDAREISEIVARGNVSIFHAGRTATSGEAVYNRVSRTIVLTRSPLVKQCTDTVKGERITVFIDQDNAVVEGGPGERVRAVIMPEKDCSGGAGKKVGVEETRCKGPR